MRSATPFISALSAAASSLRLAAPRDLLARRGAGGGAAASTSWISGPPLGVERPGIDAGEAGPGLDLLEALAAARQHGEHGVAVLDHELEVQHGARRG